MKNEKAKSSSRRPGPRPQGPFEDKRRTLTTRITDETRAALDAAAAANGRSLSQEIEFRLERSFAGERAYADMIQLAFGGAEPYGLLQVFIAMARQQEARKGDGTSWTQDKETFIRAVDAWKDFVEKQQNNPESNLAFFGRLVAPPEPGAQDLSSAFDEYIKSQKG
jgi:hypothetical protein